MTDTMGNDETGDPRIKNLQKRIESHRELVARYDALPDPTGASLFNMMSARRSLIQDELELENLLGKKQLSDTPKTCLDRYGFSVDDIVYTKDCFGTRSPEGDLESAENQFADRGVFRNSGNLEIQRGGYFLNTDLVLNDGDILLDGGGIVNDNYIQNEGTINVEGELFNKGKIVVEKHSELIIPWDADLTVYGTFYVVEEFEPFERGTWVVDELNRLRQVF